MSIRLVQRIINEGDRRTGAEVWLGASHLPRQQPGRGARRARLGPRPHRQGSVALRRGGRRPTAPEHHRLPVAQDAAPASPASSSTTCGTSPPPASSLPGATSGPSSGPSATQGRRPAPPTPICGRPPRTARGRRRSRSCPRRSASQPHVSPSRGRARASDPGLGSKTYCQGVSRWRVKAPRIACGSRSPCRTAACAERRGTSPSGLGDLTR